MRVKIPAKQRFWKYVDKTTDCWIWKGHKHKFGYGKFDNKMAHRVAWELHNGDIADKLWVLHRCDNPPCVNPDHLFLGTNLENIKDMDSKNRRARGESIGISKLTSTNVLDIRKLYKNGVKVIEIASKFKVKWNTIGRIVNGDGWSHIKGEDITGAATTKES